MGDTVAADDTTGRNSCPVWMRITAVGQYPRDQRVSIVNGSRSVPITSSSNPKYNNIPVWIEVNGEIIEKPRIEDLCDYINASHKTLQNHRWKATNKGLSETVSFGFRWGWSKK